MRGPGRFGDRELALTSSPPPQLLGPHFASLPGTMVFITSISKIMMTTSVVACGALMMVPGALWLVDRFWIVQPGLDDWD